MVKSLLERTLLERMELATELIKALVVDVLILLYKEVFQWVGV